MTHWFRNVPAQWLSFELLALFSILAVAGPVTIRAQEEPDGSAYKGWALTDFRIEGLPKETAFELEKGLALSRTEGLLGNVRPPFFPQTLKEDIRRTRLFLARRGYPRATVKARFVPEAKRERVALLLLVDPGEAVEIASVDVEGFPPSLAGDLVDVLAVEAGDVFEDRRVQEGVEALRGYLMKHGYAKAAVELRVDRTDSTRIAVAYQVAAGSRYYFGNVVIEGPGEDLVSLARKTIGVERGEPYAPDVLEDARKNLRALGLFQKFHLEIEDVAPDTVDLVADLRERDPRAVELGVSFWTDDGLSGRAKWAHRNLFGGGRGFSVSAFGSKFLQTSNASVWWSALPWRRTRTTLAVKVRREDEVNYAQITSGVSLFLRYSYSFRTSYQVGTEVSRVDVDERTPGVASTVEGTGLLWVLSLRSSRYATNDPVLPTKGISTGMILEWAPAGAVSDYHYVKLQPSASWYLPLTERQGLALRLTVGLARPTGESADLLPDRRFYSGGGNSMRGFERRQLGPKDLQGDPLGGEALLETSAEYRFPLPWILRGTLFVDAGQVWAEASDMRFETVEVALGTGVWLVTPVGPIRADFARRLTFFDTTQPREVFHFAIGAAF